MRHGWWMAAALSLVTVTGVIIALAGADSVNLGICSGIADACQDDQGKQYTYKCHCDNKDSLTLTCASDVSTSNVSWFIDGFPLDNKGPPTRHSNWEFPFDETGTRKLPLTTFYYYISGENLTITVGGICPLGSRVTLSCNSTASDEGNALSKRFGICIDDVSSRFTPLRNSSYLLSAEVLRLQPRQKSILNCTLHFGEDRRPYNYSITWLKSELPSSHANQLTLNNNLTCFQSGTFAYTSTLHVLAGEEDEKYVCVFAKTDSLNPFESSTVSKHFTIYVDNPAVFTPAKVGGVSASALIAMLIIIYIVWRFLIPIRTIMHHTCFRKQSQTGEHFKYDAVVLFDDSSQVASTFVYDLLRLKLEDCWKYILCLPQRDFLLGEDISSKIIEVTNQSRRYIFLIDNQFFDCRLCDSALQIALKNHEKIICVVLMDQRELNKWEAHLKRLEKLRALIKWNAMEDKKRSPWRRLLIPHYKWTALKQYLPPRPDFYRLRFASQYCMPPNPPKHEETVGYNAATPESAEEQL